MEYRPIEEYASEMTLNEFIELTDKEELCPSVFGLIDEEPCDFKCHDCWKNSVALAGIKFVSNLSVVPEEAKNLLSGLAIAEAHYKEISEHRDSLKTQIQSLMENYGVTKWENEFMIINYVAPSTRSSIDSTKLKKLYPDIFEECNKTSNVKASVRFKIK